jgi:hypothetical protein
MAMVLECVDVNSVTREALLFSDSFEMFVPEGDVGLVVLARNPCNLERIHN